MLEDKLEALRVAVVALTQEINSLVAAKPAPAKGRRAKKSEPEPEPKAAAEVTVPTLREVPAQAPQDGPSLDQVMSYARALSQALGAKAALLQALLGEYGCQRISELPVAKYGDFLTSMEALKNREFPENG